MSPFFATYRYKALLSVSLEPEPEGNTKLLATERAIAFVEKMKKITDLCQSSIAEFAQKQEDNANKTRTPALIYWKGDKV
jgi:hypothetical protein